MAGSRLMCAEEDGSIGSTRSRDSRLPPPVWFLFWAIVLVGVLLKWIAVDNTGGIVHPDEHQQYLETAQGIVFGYSVAYWEHERGVRHCLYPGLLAGILYVLEYVVAVRDPVSQAAVIRFLLSVAVLASFALVAYDWMQRRKTAGAFFLLALAAFSPDMIFVSVRTLSETAMMVPLLVGLFFLRRNPLVAGVLFGIMFAVRFQSAVLIAAMVMLAFLEDLRSGESWLRRPSSRLATGLAASMLCLGLVDKLIWDGWFHTPIGYFTANVLEGLAATEGVQPWYRYFQWGLSDLLEASPILLVFLLLGIRRGPQLALAAAVFLAAHSLVPHKQPRFVWPILPLALMLMALGFEQVYQWLGDRTMRLVGVALIVCALLPGVWLRFESIQWNLEPSRGASLVLAKVGRLPDLTGVAIYGAPDVVCGNYFFLRRDVPYIAKGVPDHEVIRSNPDWQQGTINYLITHPKEIHLFEEARPHKVDAAYGWSVYEVNGQEALREAPSS